jgi:hypothetical protein
MHLLDRTDLLTRGFVGFVPLRTLDPASLDSGPAVYAVLRPDRTDPVFLSRSPAGWWKRKDPSVPLARLRSNWLDAVDLVYLGKADSLCSRIGELLDFASGLPVRHWGGRLLWQVDVPYELAWLLTPGEDPEVIEKGLLWEFSDHYRGPCTAHPEKPVTSVQLLEHTSSHKTNCQLSEGRVYLPTVEPSEMQFAFAVELIPRSR